MKTIKECLDIAVATPLTTIGMGNVEPGKTDGVPCAALPNKKQKKCKKRKMKSLKDYIKREEI